MQLVPIESEWDMALPATTTGRQVYQQIEKAGDKGAWSKSLKDQTKLQQHTITKVQQLGLRMLGILSTDSDQHVLQGH